MIHQPNNLTLSCRTCSNKCKIDSSKCLVTLLDVLMKWVNSSSIIGKRIDDIEKSINDIMNELGEED